MSISEYGGADLEVTATGAQKLRLKAETRLSVWSWTSTRYAKTAVLMAKKCAELEGLSSNLAQDSSEWNAASAEHWASASSSLVASVMFLEAHINELFLSAAFAQELKDAGFVGKPFPDVGGLLSDRDQKKLAGTWDMMEKTSILDKYVFVLHLLDRARIDKGNLPFQCAALLVRARNELVHSKQGEHEVGRELVKLESSLKDKLGGKGFICHPYTGDANAFFPDQFLGYVGCRWAWESADAFVQEFRRSLGIDPAYQKFRAELTF